MVRLSSVFARHFYLKRRTPMNETPVTDLLDASPSKIAALYTESTIAERLKAAQRRVNLDDAEMAEIVMQYIQDTPAMFENLNPGLWTKSRQRKGTRSHYQHCA